MTDRLDRLYNLLPAVHRMRDVDQGEPLRALLRVIAEQVNVVEDDIAGLYANWFIETCEDWVVPYIGQLVGYEPAVDPGLAADNSTPSGRLRARAIFPRADVANTVRNRRRKGTLSILETIASDSADWPAHAVEFFKLLAWAENVAYTHRRRTKTLDMRKGDVLDLLGTPFDSSTHLVDVRRISSAVAPGRYNIPNVGVFVWRLKSYSVTRTTAHCNDRIGQFAYTFSVLANDAPLFINPSAHAGPESELNFPGPIRRGGLALHTAAYVPNSFTIDVPNWPRPGSSFKIVSADLSNWAAYRARKDTIAVDPVLGRILFPKDQAPQDDPLVSYHYGFSADMGGGEYKRVLSEVPGSQVFKIGPNDNQTIQSALDAWQKAAPKNAVIEFTESAVFTEPVRLDVPAGASLELRAASGARPVLRLLDWQAGKVDAFLVSGGAGSRVILDGLTITGRSVNVTGAVSRLTIRHSTLVPGWDLGADCTPLHPADPSLDINSATVAVCIEHSITGPIRVTIPPPDNWVPPPNSDHADAIGCKGYRADPLCMNISDSIIDATNQGEKAIGSLACSVAHICLRIQRTSVFGMTQVHVLDLAEDSIFTGQVFVARRQTGCVRFCYVAPDSRTPKRYECQPPQGSMAPEPFFNSRRYGHPTYAQLSLDCPVEISAGASDQSEMGAFHDLYQPQRTALLRARINEALPAGMDAGIIFET